MTFRGEPVSIMCISLITSTCQNEPTSQKNVNVQKPMDLSHVIRPQRAAKFYKNAAALVVKVLQFDHIPCFLAENDFTAQNFREHLGPVNDFPQYTLRQFLPVTVRDTQWLYLKRLPVSQSPVTA